MVCEIISCCQFFNNKMKDLPKTSSYLKDKLCFGTAQDCVRYRIYKEFGGENIPFDLHPDDLDEVEKLMKCLRNRLKSENA